jgi:protocatechuate 3,4-dioxygenase beta subunit
MLAACGDDSSGSSSSGTTRGTTSGTTATSGAASSPSGAAVACVLTPEMTEGPYYLNGEAVRSDITEGKDGTPLRLELLVADASACRPIANAAVDLWHADATGNYSGFGSTTSNRSFLRGTQMTGTDGKVTFLTLYPGWYQGRATHIHVKVHVSGSTVHTGQLFFDEAQNNAVYATAPYSSHTGSRTTNTQDSIYGSGGSQSLVTITKSGSGYVGTMTMGVKI